MEAFTFLPDWGLTLFRAPAAVPGGRRRILQWEGSPEASSW